MAFIDLLIGKNVQGEIDRLVKELEKVHQQVLSINQTGLNLSGSKSAVNSSELNKMINDFNELTNAQQRASKQLVDLAIKEERLSHAQNRTNISNNNLEKSTISLEKARDNAAKAQERELAKLQASQSLYNKTQQQINNLTRAYNELAVKKERNKNLTENEEKRLKTLSDTIGKYNTVLKGVDATIGKHTRNVGNYAGSFNPLSNSIEQLSRELPALGNGFQTFAMAISNNLPVFFDALKNTNEQIKVLRAEGQQVPSLFSQLSSSFFTVGNALSIGVALFTIFSKQIGEAIFNTKAKKEADEAAKKAIDEKNEAEKRYIETIQNAGGGEIARSQILFENARNVNMSMADRKKAIDDLRERYPKYLKNLTDEQILSGNTADAENKLNEALLKRGIALALQDKITEAYKKLVDEIIKEQKEKERGIGLNDKVRRKQLEEIKNLKDNADAVDKLKQQQEAFNKANLAEKINIKNIENSKLRQKTINDEIEQLFKLFDIYSPFLSTVSESNDKLTKSKEKQNEVYKIGTEKWLTEQISKLEELRSKQADSTEEYKNSTGAIKFYQFWLENLRGSQDKLNESQEKSTKIGTVDYYNQIISKLKEQQAATADNIAEYEVFQKKIDLYQTLLDNLTGNTKKTGDEAKKQLKEINSYLESFIDSFAGQSGFPTIFKILRNEIKGFGKDATTTALAVSEAFQEMYNFLNQGSEDRFRAELERNEQQKNIAIQFAGESKTAREEIERQYEEKRKEIQRRQAKAEKEKALFNAIINTAQAVVAALPNIPLSVAIGVIGAAQAAMIAARPLPEFWTGTENAPEGLAKTQERGREIITDSNDRIKSWGSDKGTRIDYLKKGDKVINAENTKKIIDQAMFMNSLNGLLLENTIGTIPFKLEQKNDNSGVISEIKALRNDLANSQSSLIITRDKRGERTFEYKNGVKRELLNNSLKGVAKYVK